jgi:uncharacterized cupredoxin-like copper-binding protein
MACWRAPLGKMLAAALLVAGCAASAQGPVAVTVDLVDYRFVPDHLVFRRGVAYRLHLANKGGEQHEFTAPEFQKSIEIENPEVVGTYGTEIVLQPGEQKDLEFMAPQPGTFKLIGSDRDWAGMVGEITVE